MSKRRCALRLQSASQGIHSKQGGIIQGIPNKSALQILGIYIDQNMKLNHQIKEVKKRTDRGMKMIGLLQWKHMEP